MLGPFAPLPFIGGRPPCIIGAWFCWYGYGGNGGLALAARSGWNDMKGVEAAFSFDRTAGTAGDDNAAAGGSDDETELDPEAAVALGSAAGDIVQGRPRRSGRGLPGRPRRSRDGRGERWRDVKGRRGDEAHQLVSGG